MDDINIYALARGVRVEMDGGLDREEATKEAQANLEAYEHAYDPGHKLTKDAKLRTAKKFKLKAPPKSEFKVPGHKTKTLTEKVRAKMSKFMRRQG